MTSMVNDAVQYYHDLLTPDVAEEADFQLRKKLRDRNLYFGDRPLCVVLRPYFYSERNWMFLNSGLEKLLEAFNIVHQVCIQNPKQRAYLMLDDYEEQLIPYDKPSVPPWSSSRLDMFYVTDKDVLKCVEYNAETPAGIGYADMLGEVFAELEPFKRFGEKYHTFMMPALDNLTDSLIDAYLAWGGQRFPQVAIVDWREVPTLTEHEITRQHFERKGLKAVLADPRSMEYKDGKLWADGFRVDMIYKRVLYSELFATMGIDNPITRAVRDGNVFITNSISAKMLAKKASLAFLSDTDNAHFFSADQLSAIHTHIPWTRVVKEGKTTYEGQVVDLLPFLTQNRDKFVLKPNDDYGGRGVVLGWECSSDGWEAALKQGLNVPHVVQERVEIVQRNFPMWLNGELDISPRFVDADPYVFGGKMVYGLMTRLSPLSLLNVTAGGGSIVPTVLIEKRR
ncbi:MAG: circularly permuted type 2 ATP-grasp protein [Anaerolineae bacterium]|nr:circularly permuted type 2 ATP-grasp protein [Anaerolineae bacterium]